MIEKLKKWNEWWTFGKVHKSKLGIKREALLSELNKLMKPREILILSGVRRSGKSTMLYQLIEEIISTKVNPKNIFYFNFDETIKEKDEKALDLIYNTFLELNNPKGKKYIFFDEIQNIKNWERWIKKNYDLYGKEVKFILTGSNNTLLQDNLSKLLTGRMLTKTIWPLSFKEFLEFKNVRIKDPDLQKKELKHYLMQYLEKGGFPEVDLEEDPYINEHRLKEYYDSILLRDIVQPNNIREVSKIKDLASYCMTNISSILSYSKISKAIWLNITSLKEYLHFLENSYLIFQLNIFSYSLRESVMIQKPRKIFCIDNGLRNAVSFKFSKDDGMLAENLVFIELKRREAELYYWLDSTEVDFIVKNKDNSLTAINVTYTNNINERELKGLIELKKRLKKIKKVILLTKDIEKCKKIGGVEIQIIPLWKWLLIKS